MTGVYARMEFAPYKYQPYPRWIKLKDGSQVIAQTKEDELRLIATDPSNPPPPTQAEIERDALVAEVAELRARVAQAEAKASTKATPPVAGKA